MSPTTIALGTLRPRATGWLGIRVLAVVLSVSTSLFGQSSAATVPAEDAPSVRLVLEAGPGTADCLSAAELAQAAQAQLGRPVFVAGDAPAETVVRVRFEPTPAGFRVEASLETANEAPQPGAPALAARELETQGDCRSLDEQLVLVVALLADSGSDGSELSPEPPPEPAPEEPPPPPEERGPVSTAPSWEQSRRGPWTLVLDAGAVAAFGVMPDVSFGAELAAGLAPPGWPLLRLRALVFLPGRIEVEPGARLDFLVGMAGVGVCPELLGAARASLRACFGGDVILRRAESHGLERSRATTRVTGQGTLGLRAGLGFGQQWRATAGIGVGLVTHIDRFSYRRGDAFESAFEPAFVPLFLSLGVANEFR